MSECVNIHKEEHFGCLELTEVQTDTEFYGSQCMATPYYVQCILVYH